MAPSSVPPKEAQGIRHILLKNYTAKEIPHEHDNFNTHGASLGVDGKAVDELILELSSNVNDSELIQKSSVYTEQQTICNNDAGIEILNADAIKLPAEQSPVYEHQFIPSATETNPSNNGLAVASITRPYTQQAQPTNASLSQQPIQQLPTVYQNQPRQNSYQQANPIYSYQQQQPNVWQQQVAHPQYHQSVMYHQPMQLNAYQQQTVHQQPIYTNTYQQHVVHQQPNGYQQQMNAYQPGVLYHQTNHQYPNLATQQYSTPFGPHPVNPQYPVVPSQPPNGQYLNGSASLNQQHPTVQMNVQFVGHGAVNPQMAPRTQVKNSFAPTTTSVVPPVTHKGYPVCEAPPILSSCHENLNPAYIPLNPLDETSEQTTSLERELAWLVEETHFLLPQLPTDENAVLFDLAWLFGSLELRHLLCNKFPNLVAGKLNDSNRSKIGTKNVLDANQLLPDETDKEQFQQLRQDALVGLNLGHRRSDSLEQILNKIRRFRLRRALEELGDDKDQALDNLAFKKTKRKRRRRVKGFDPFNDESNLSKIAMDVPKELNEIEEEIAWLCEESLLLLPKTQHIPTSTKECIVSAGLLTEAPDVNWEYVTEHASPTLKHALQKIRGGLSNRTLSKVVRSSQVHVRLAFLKRREMTAKLITFGGFRRLETQQVLPTNDELIQSGYIDILKAKLIRRLQQNKIEELASSQDLNVACNQRIGETPASAPAKKRVARTSSDFKRKRGRLDASAFDSDRTLLAELEGLSPAKHTGSPLPPDAAEMYSSTDLPSTSVLNINEEELAWLRVECEIETGLKGYNWEYIETYATRRLKQEMMNCGVLLSVFPTVAGVSKLKTMVRLDDEAVYDAFRQKCRDIRWAIQNGFRRDLRKKDLPNIPSAPAKNGGTRVLDVECAHDGLEYKRLNYDFLSKAIASHIRAAITKRGADECRQSSFEFTSDHSFDGTSPTGCGGHTHANNRVERTEADILPFLAFDIEAPETSRDHNHTSKYEASKGSSFRSDDNADIVHEQRHNNYGDSVESEEAGTCDDTSEDRDSDGDYVLESEDENDSSSACSASESI